MAIKILDDLKDKNGLPYFINNLNTHHKLNLMDKVSIPKSEDDNQYWLNDHPEFKSAIEEGKSFYVVGHLRDCDGTPLYDIANTDFETAIKLCKACRYSGRGCFYKDIDDIFNLDICDRDGNFKNPKDFFNINRFLDKILIRNLGEETLVKV